jgi:hypothetical protein
VADIQGARGIKPPPKNQKSMNTPLNPLYFWNKIKKKRGERRREGEEK